MNKAPYDSAVTSNDEDVGLMMRIGKGEEKALEALILKHQGAVVGTITKMLGSSTESEDIAQQVFIRLWKSAPKYKPTAKFTTFLFTILRNLVFNETRKKRHKMQVSLEAQGEEWGAQYSEPEGKDPAQESLQSELIKAVDTAISKLPKKQRLAVVLRRYEEMPYEEIAQVLNTSVSAVKSHLFRARTTLKEELAGYLNQ